MTSRISGLITATSHPGCVRLVLHPSDTASVDIPIASIVSRKDGGPNDLPGAVSLEVADDAILIFSKSVSSTIEAKLLGGRIADAKPENRSAAFAQLANQGVTGVVCTFGCCESTAITNFGCSDTRGCCECTVGTDQTVTCYTC
jgi:hypothetical protein